MDDGDRNHLLALLAAVGSVPTLWSGPGGRVASNALTEPTRHWPLRTVEYPSPTHIGGTTDLTYLLYNHVGGVSFTTRGFPSLGGNADRATRELRALSCLGLYDNCGGEKSTPPMVSLL